MATAGQAANGAVPQPVQTSSPSGSGRRAIFHSMIGGVVSSGRVLGVASPFYQGWVNRRFAQLDQGDQATRRVIEQLVSETQAFMILVASFATPLSQDGRVDPDARQRLVSNLLGQRALLGQISLRVPDSYERSLDAFHASMVRVTGVETMREFWSRASDLLVARQELLTGLAPLV
jgi:hypothetical protein